MRKAAIVLAALAVSACPKPPPEGPPKRAALNRTGGSTFEVLPAPGQAEHCLIFTVAKNGLTRQLTMSKKNLAYECPAGVPVGKHSYRVPVAEGPVKVFVLFTSQAVNAGAVAQEILEAPDRQKLNAMNLRLPGAAQLEVLDFTPEEDVAPEVGGLVTADAGLGHAEAPDAADAGP